MATNKASYGTLTSATLTIASLANGAARESLKVDNTSTCFMDLLVAIEAVLAAGSPAGAAALNVYLVPSPDGSLWPSPATGADSSITFTSANPVAGHLIGSIPVAAGGATVKGVFGTVLAFDNKLVLPPYFSFVIENQSGVVLTTCTVQYKGLQIASV